MRRRLQRQRAGIGIIVAQEREFLRPLMSHDVPLGGNVRLHRLVPVQVIGCDVEHCRDVRAHRHHLQLKTGEFHHHPIARPDLIQIGDERVADVAPHPGTQPRRATHLPHQRRRRRLASRASDADDGGRALLQEDLRIVAQQDPTPLRLYDDRDIHRHPSAETQQIGLVQQTERVLSQHIADRQVRQLRQIVGQCCLVLQVRDRHLRPGQRQEARQRGPLPCQTKDYHSRIANGEWRLFVGHWPVFTGH